MESAVSPLEEIPVLGRVVAIAIASTRASVVDEYGELQRRLRLHQPDADRAAELREIIRGWYEDAGPDSTFTEVGRNYRLDIGRRSNQRKITSMRRLARAIGQSAWWAHCEYPLKFLAGLLPDDSGLVSETRTGPRRIEAVAVSSPDSAA